MSIDSKRLDDILRNGGGEVLYKSKNNKDVFLGVYKRAEKEWIYEPRISKLLTVEYAAVIADSLNYLNTKSTE